MPRFEDAVTEPTERVRLIVHHRHGEGACGGVAFVALKRFVPRDIPQASDFTWPSGMTLENGERMRCDACGRPLKMADAEEDLREAGAYPDSVLEHNGRLIGTYSTPFGADLEWQAASRARRGGGSERADEEGAPE